MKKLKKLTLSWAIIIFLSSVSFAQESLLSQVERLYQRAIDNKASVYSPSKFERGEQLLKNARTDIRNNKSADIIRNKLNEAQKYLTQAITSSETTKDYLMTLISSRESALKVNAHQKYANRFNIAEAKFREAFVEAEKGDFKKASSIGVEAEDIFNQLELLAIKDEVIGKAEQLFAEAKSVMADYYAPKSFANIEPLIKKAHEILERDRYNREDAKIPSLQAEYEARHAIYLAGRIKELKDNEQSFEDIFLEFEYTIYELAQKLKIGVRFDNGLEEPINTLAERFYTASEGKEDLGSEFSNFLDELAYLLQITVLPGEDKKQKIIDEIKDIKNSKSTLAEENTQLRQRIYNLTEDLAKIREEQTMTQAEIDRLQTSLDTQNLKEEKYKNIERLYNRREAEVLRDGDNIILRLYRINFQSGKHEILRSHHEILNKVISTIGEFPNCSVIVEGHTDSQGKAESNNVLSQKRAESVRQYIVSNMNIAGNKIRAVGYGQTRPVADNSTAAGRAKNRRIEIIIMPRF